MHLFTTLLTFLFLLSYVLGSRDARSKSLLRRADAATTTKLTATVKAAASTAAAASGTKASKSDSKPTAAQSVPNDAPAGGFTMVTPAQTTQTYAKIGAQVTFVWNYTSLLAPPSAIDVVASNTAGVWTIAGNISAQETSVVWNTGDEATELPMESYTLMIYDADLGATAVPKPGHLNPYIGYGFAMYNPKKPVQAKDFYCVTCNGAISSMERQSLTVLLGTCALTVLSFTYFSCGFLGVF